MSQVAARRISLRAVAVFSSTNPGFTLQWIWQLILLRYRLRLTYFHSIVILGQKTPQDITSTIKILARTPRPSGLRLKYPTGHFLVKSWVIYISPSMVRVQSTKWKHKVHSILMIFTTETWLQIHQDVAWYDGDPRRNRAHPTRTKMGENVVRKQSEEGRKRKKKTAQAIYMSGARIPRYSSSTSCEVLLSPWLGPRFLLVVDK